MSALQIFRGVQMKCGVQLPHCLNITGETPPANLLPPRLGGALPGSGGAEMPESAQSPPAQSAQRIDRDMRQRLIREVAYRRYAPRGFVAIEP